MSIQIFKTKVETNKLFELLDKICIKNDKYYTFNFDSFKKGIYEGSIVIFFEEIKDNYFISKRKYLEKKLTFNSVITVIRQIMKYNNIYFTSKIIYTDGAYSIIYYIYF